VSNVFGAEKATILDPQVLTDGELKPKLSHFVTSLLHSTSVCNTFDRELSENKEGGETDGPGSLETGHSQGNLSLIAIVLPDARLYCGKKCFKRKTISKDDWTTHSLWGERGSKGCNRFLHPFRGCFKKGAAYIFQRRCA